MNSFILNYVENDITHRAIMLTGAWGSGKSYYIKNTLKPFLERKKHKCALVSLYGLSDVSEISKAIYVDLRTIKKETTSEVGNTAKVVGKIVGKTIFNGLVGKIGFDIGDINEEDLQKIYESIDLTDKLVILEDIERTQIDIIELLGFINNMCENDGVKVLLVANEDEMIKFHMEEKKTTNKYGIENTVSEKVYSEKALKYLKAKEKTISDTLQFQCDYYQTIDSIVDSFENSDLCKAKDYLRNNREESIFGISIFNFRELIVACQKACDIFRYMESENIVADDEFKICVTVGLVFYLQKRISNNDLQFKSKTLFDTELSGKEIYPLMRFCYDYYNEQILNEESIRKAIEEYEDYLLYLDKSAYEDNDLKILYNIYTNYEKEINSAIDNIYNRLQIKGNIGFNQYDRIINHLLIFKYDAGSNNEKIDLIIEIIIRNLKGKGDKFTKKNLLFTNRLHIQNPEGIAEFEKIKKEVFASLEYSPEEKYIEDTDFATIINTIHDNMLWKDNPDKMMDIIPLDRLITYITTFSPEAMDCLRYIFIYMNFQNLSREHLKSIEEFQKQIENLSNNDSELDRIQKLQLRWMSDNISKKLQELK